MEKKQTIVELMEETIRGLREELDLYKRIQEEQKKSSCDNCRFSSNGLCLRNIESHRLRCYDAPERYCYPEVCRHKEVGKCDRFIREKPSCDNCQIAYDKLAGQDVNATDDKYNVMCLGPITGGYCDAYKLKE